MQLFFSKRNDSSPVAEEGFCASFLSATSHALNSTAFLCHLSSC